MAAEKHNTKPLEDVIKNLNVNPPPKIGDANLIPPKDGSPSEATSCISSSGDATGSIKESDVDHESMMAEQGMYYPAGSYYGYYYPGYDGSVGEWEDQGYILGSDGLEAQYPAVHADNGSLIYYMPGLQPGYVPYSPYLPGTAVGIDGQYLTQQPYLSSSMYPQPITPPGYFPTSLPYGSEFVPSYLWDPSLIVGDGVHANAYGGIPAIPGSNQNFAAPGQTVAYSLPTKSSNPVEVKGSMPVLDVSSSPGMLNQLKPVSKAAAALTKGYFPMPKLPSSNQGKGGLLYPNSSIYKGSGRGWSSTEKQKERNKANGISEFDLLNEQNRGPRTNNAKGTMVSVVGLPGSLSSEDNSNSNISTTIIRRDQYNLPDFTTKYDQSLFYVIKSYSEDDIHKSIKYNVWASTPNGNKRLDSAYQDAQERMREKGSKCPVFLFFSVNASGQFCGVAEMVGRVDFNKNMDFWQQDKWNGFFPVKWHIIKDVPNPQFRHIILENNDNKPVTNSRDTQEVRFPQGVEMLNIFKSYMSKTSILDDFAFYESRQKAMQDKRMKPSTMLAHLQKPDEMLQLTKDIQSIDLSGIKKSQEELLVEGEEHKSKE